LVVTTQCGALAGRPIIGMVTYGEMRDEYLERDRDRLFGGTRWDFRPSGRRHLACRKSR
jgi:hypothetical protein